ncbi:MAG: NAD-dependent epimerase/dehydratase family protein [Calditrichaeota bacterium]|nr:MAG: NAD-dependent epimerase/dehydratase family protein [Calditrichota bacterium]
MTQKKNPDSGLDPLRGAAILVTGAAGFIGSHLVESLLARRVKVVGIDNFDPFYDRSIKERNLQAALADPSYTFREISILDQEALAALFEEFPFTHVVHLAAKAGVRPSLQQPRAYYRTNIDGTLNLLELCRQHGIKKFVFASSSSVYGNNKKVPFSEADFVDHPISPYAATKKSGELLCYTYHHLYGLDVFALRFFTVYGPRQRPEMAIHKFIRHIDQEIPIPVYGFGKPRRDYTYIDDILQGVVRSIERVSGFEVFNLGESRTTSTNELIEIIEDRLGKKAIREDMPMQPGDVEITYADISKARRLLDYRPTTPVEDGISKFVNWYLENKSYAKSPK